MKFIKAIILGFKDWVICVIGASIIILLGFPYFVSKRLKGDNYTMSLF